MFPFTDLFAHQPFLQFAIKKIFIYLIIWLQRVLVLACETFNLRCSMQYL